MDTINISSWEDYWKLFDLLVNKVKQHGQMQIVAELKEAQKYVNGLTDGWFEFKGAMELIFEANKSMMTSDEINIIKILIETLNRSLADRN